MIGRIALGVLIGAGIGALLGYFGKCSSGTCPLTANPYRGALYGALMGGLFALAFSGTAKSESQKLNRRQPGKVSVSSSAAERLTHIHSEADFNALVLGAGGICLVDLFSNRCPPCKVLAPTISSLADRYAGTVTVCKVDLDRLPTLAQRYRVRAVPTVLIIKDGKLVKRLVGLRPKAEYVAVLDMLINESEQ